MARKDLKNLLKLSEDLRTVLRRIEELIKEDLKKEEY